MKKIIPHDFAFTLIASVGVLSGLVTLKILCEVKNFARL